MASRHEEERYQSGADPALRASATTSREQARPMRDALSSRAMAEQRAEVRAPLTKAIVELLDRQLPHVRSAIRARAADAITRVEECSRVDWIPLGVQLDLLGAFRDELGPRAYDDFCIAHFASTIEQPFVKGMFETTVRLFGLGPGPVYRVFAKTWAVISRGCGELTVTGESTPGVAVIHLRDLPMAEPQIDLFVNGYRATFQGVIEVCGARGDVEVVSFDRAKREAVYRARWSERA